MADGPPTSSRQPLTPEAGHVSPSQAGSEVASPESAADATVRLTDEISSNGLESHNATSVEAGTNILDDKDAHDVDAWLVGETAESHPEEVLQEASAQASGVKKEDAMSGIFPMYSQGFHTAVPLAACDAELPDLASEQPPLKSVTHEARPATTTAQHSSSMSFSRMVSHEVSFNDDDDSEWNLARSGAEALGFTTPVDNGDAPQANLSLLDGEDDVPLPSNPISEITQEAEKEPKVDEQRSLVFEVDGAEPQTSSEPTRDWLQSQDATAVMASNDQGPKAEAADGCNDEGVSLASRTGETADTGNETFIDTIAHDIDDNYNLFLRFAESELHDGSPASDTQKIIRGPITRLVGEQDQKPASHHSTPKETASDRHDPQDKESAKRPDQPHGFNTQIPGEDLNEKQTATEDLTTKWRTAFAGDDGDDDFLLEDSTADGKDIDKAAFLGSDDEGLLEEDGDEDETEVVSKRQPTPTVFGRISTSSSFTPTFQQLTTTPQSASTAHLYQQPTPAPFHQSAPQLRPEQPRAQGFVDKSKDSYSSPYDMPSDLISNTLKPRKRTSLQQLPREQMAPPPRTSSMYSQGRIAATGTSTFASTPNQRAPPSMPRSRSSFFEDLPITARPKPSSRQASMPPPSSPHAPIGNSQPTPPMTRPLSPYFPVAASQSPGVTGFAAPVRTSHFVTPQSPTSSVPLPSGVTSKYSPAPPAQIGTTAPTAAHQYSPAPSGSRPGSSYNTTALMTPSLPSLPHLPRTLSPMAHFEASSDGVHRTVALPNGDAHQADRRVNSFEPRLNRVSSLPPTHEVDEEDDGRAGPGNGVIGSAHAPHANSEIKSSSAPYLPIDRQTPPPPSRYVPASALTSRGASISYMPQVAPTTQPGLIPPPRSSTQSPVAMQGDQAPHMADFIDRPSSAHAFTGPLLPKTSLNAHLPVARTRGKSLLLNMVPPTERSEHDPLERWKGAPVLAWGVGGTIATSFPRSIPRYTMNQTAPTIMRTCGDVKVQSIKDIDPLAERLAKFPGPLKGKSKKKDALAWLAAGIDAQEKDLPDIAFHPKLSLEAKRGVERLLLWKLLRVFIEYDGTLEGNPAVEKAVQGILVPSVAGTTAENSASPLAAAIGDQADAATSMMADSVDPVAMEQIRLALLSGNRETAVWSAVDKRLWGHAMLISHTVSPDLYKQVAQEFVRKEVNYSGHNESIAALYKVLSGNFDDCVDELVPLHARLGLQLVSKESVSGSARDGVDGLDKWRETLTLILNNRSPEDVQGLYALGKLLSGYGRAEAAHICFLFSRTRSVFGGLDDQKSDFVLLGSDHRQQPDHFAKETEALQLSELYEYGLSLSGSAAFTTGVPHLAAYKLQYAVTLAEYGYRDKALHYCDAIAAAMVAQTRRSSYHHAILEVAVDDFMTRLKQAPKDASSSWISKPSMNKVSDSMWNRFNKFVAGDDSDNAGHGGSGEAESGPFARVASTPNMSRSPSASNFEAFSLVAATSAYSANPAPALISAASSRYAPALMSATATANPYAAVSPHQAASTSSGRSSSEYPRHGYEPSRPGTGSSTNQNSTNNGPTAYAASKGVTQPFQADAARIASNGALALTASRSSPSGHRPHGIQESPNIYPHSETNESKMHLPARNPQLSAYTYEPPQMTAASNENERNVDEPVTTQGYEPPSYQPYGYEPPSYQPDPEPRPSDEDEAGASKPKKSFMDYEEDDTAGLRSAAKAKAEKYRENAEMFRKAAEEDAKRAAAQQPGKKGWGFSGWFGGAKKSESGTIGETAASNVVQAKLGESSSFVYDPELKRWVNKAGAEVTEAKKATPPPPSVLSSSSTPPMAAGRSSSSPLAGPPQLMSGLSEKSHQGAIGLDVSAMSRSASHSRLAAGPPSGPPSRPPTSMSHASSIDDLLNAAAPRKPGQKKPRKSGRYVDVMAK